MISFRAGYYGWLGNQMFQYAATKALSLRMNTECGFPENKPNLYSIFNLTSEKTIENTKARFFYDEPSFNYSPIPAAAKDVILHGYFQSEKYFKDFEDEIRKEFTFKSPSRIAVKPNTVSIHVRRGDYVNQPQNHPLCDLKYYSDAMALFDSKEFMVFSDDLDWCRENIKGDNITYSEGSSPEEDLYLMTQCDHHIIANSSFSWWGAWLGHNEEKTVVAPKVWFGESKPLPTEDIYCDGWIKI